MAGLALLLFAGAAPAQAPSPAPAPVIRPAGGALPPVGGPLPSLPEDEAVRPAAGWQQDEILGFEQATPYPIQLEPPGLERLAQSVQSDEALRERIRQESRERRPMQRDVFPPDPIISTETYRGRKWEPATLEVAPYYVAYRKLHFEEKNAERYGWDLGIFQPAVSTAYFLFDWVMLPYSLATAPFRPYDFNTGYCLPGDPVPYFLYPPEISATGFVAEVGTILALVAIFP